MPTVALPARRRFMAAAAACVLAPRVARAEEPGPWVLVEQGEALLQLQPGALAPLRRLALSPRWSTLIAGGAVPLGRGSDGTLRRPGVERHLPRATGPVAVSADGRWMCAVEDDGLQLRDAALAPLRRWPLPAVPAWLMDLPLRRAFVLAFAGRPELWQLSYDERAEDFYDGLVHDYRFGEGVPTRAFHNVRRMALPEPLLDASADATQSELAGQGWVFNLDARKRVRLQPLLEPPGPGSGAACRLQGRPVLAQPVRGQARLDLFGTDGWERVASVDLPWPAERALSHAASDTLVLQAGAELGLLRLAGGAVLPVAGLGPVRSRPRFSGDGQGLWVLTDAALVRVDLAGARLRETLPLDRPLALA